jgi:hypothetical protein
MKLINKNQVSHIIVFQEKEGIWCRLGYWVKMLFVPYKKHKWYEFDKETKEGYYENGVSYHYGMYRSVKVVQENSKEWFVKDNSLWTKPFIQIFSGNSLIHEEYFDSYDILKAHLEFYYNEINIKYN